jgi:hypothetical protein
MSGSQIVMSSSYYDNPTRIYQFKFDDDIDDYVNTWGSNLIPTYFISGLSVGDVDGDSVPEITAVVKKEGKGKHFVKIYMYREGNATGKPDYESPDLGNSLQHIRDSIIADADNDGKNELIVVVDSSIMIFRWNGFDFINIWNSRTYPDTIFSVDVGDANNDGENEIVLAPFSVGSPIILESVGHNVWGNEQLAEPVPIEYYRPGYDWLGIDYAKVRDADNFVGGDNEKDNEIVAGGTNNRLMIWKYNKNTGLYEIQFISEDLGGFTMGVDAGDIDGDESNEVITVDSVNNNIYRFNYIGGSTIESTYERVVIFSSDHYVAYPTLGNLDNDPEDEIVVRVPLHILDFDGTLSLTWEFPYSGPFEIWEWEDLNP